MNEERYESVQVSSCVQSSKRRYNSKSSFPCCTLNIQNGILSVGSDFSITKGHDFSLESATHLKDITCSENNRQCQVNSVISTVSRNSGIVFWSARILNEIWYQYERKAFNYPQMLKLFTFKHWSVRLHVRFWFLSLQVWLLLQNKFCISSVS